MIFLSIFFGLFTFCMLFDQFDSITTSVSGIDALKKDYSYVKSTRESLREVFGGDGRFSLDWLIPINQHYTNIYEIQGYIPEEYSVQEL